MSKATNKIEAIFKGVPWTGGSDIHRSLANGGVAPFSQDQHNELMYMLSKAKIGEHIWGTIQKYFGEAEFLVSMAEFSQLAMVDFSRHMRGLGDIESDQKLTNPHTGNRFHRIALAGDIVCGIRFWCDPYGDQTAVGYRFRVEALDEEEERTRVRMRETMEAVTTEVEVLEEAMFEVKEPIHESEVETLVKKMDMEVEFNDY